MEGTECILCKDVEKNKTIVVESPKKLNENNKQYHNIENKMFMHLSNPPVWFDCIVQLSIFIDKYKLTGTYFENISMGIMIHTNYLKDARQNDDIIDFHTLPMKLSYPIINQIKTPWDKISSYTLVLCNISGDKKAEGFILGYPPGVVGPYISTSKLKCPTGKGEVGFSTEYKKLLLPLIKAKDIVKESDYVEEGIIFYIYGSVFLIDNGKLKENLKSELSVTKVSQNMIDSYYERLSSTMLKKDFKVDKPFHEADMLKFLYSTSTMIHSSKTFAKGIRKNIFH